MTPICLGEHVIDRGQINAPKDGAPVAARYTGSPTSYETVYSETVNVAHLRFKKLEKYRLLFGVLSLLGLALLVVSLLVGVRYEPSAAILCCFVGIFVVFTMKIRDAH